MTADKRLVEAILAGKVFIYPTDTIYGIGCNAFDSTAIAKIRSLKRRDQKPFSVIAPSVSWIRANCIIDNPAEEALKKLPGPFTLILNLRDDVKLPNIINPLGNNTIGIRIPKNWFAEVVSRAGVPFITTSVNLNGQPHMTSMKDLDETIKNGVDFIIYEGELKGQPSTKIDLTK